MTIKAPPPNTQLGPGWLSEFARDIERSMRAVAGPGIEVTRTDAGQIVALAASVDRFELARITSVGGTPSAPTYGVQGLRRTELVFTDMEPSLGRPSDAPVAAAVDDLCLLVRVPGGGWALWITTERAEFETSGAQAMEFVRIQGSTQIGQNRWRYTCIKVVPFSGGGWAPSGDATLYDAFNSMETFNTASGVQGNGVNASTLPAGFTIRPIASTVVMAQAFTFNNETEYRFTAPNAVDGSCDGGGTPV